MIQLADASVEYADADAATATATAAVCRLVPGYLLFNKNRNKRRLLKKEKWRREKKQPEERLVEPIGRQRALLGANF